MSKVVKVILICMGVLVVAGGLVFAGAVIGRRTGFGFGWMHPGYNHDERRNAYRSKRQRRRPWNDGQRKWSRPRHDERRAWLR